MGLLVTTGLHFKSPAIFQTSTSITNGRMSRRPVFPNNCLCKSLFSVGACGLEQVVGFRPQDSNWVSAVRGLGKARREGDVLMRPHLATLARYLPPLFTVNITAAHGKTELAVKADKNLSRSLPSLPFLPCQVHVYTPKEVLACTRKFEQNTGSPLRIAFVGDSRVRNTMEQMIRVNLNTLQLKLTGEQNIVDLKDNFLDNKVKVNVPVQGEGLELRLHWSAFLEIKRNPSDVSKQGARDLLEAWASGTPSINDGPIPDIIYATSGLWDTSMDHDDTAVDQFLYMLTVMSPTLERLSQLTRVIWHVHGPIKEWLALRDIPNAGLDMMNRAAWLKLGQSGVWLWDSHTIMMLRQHAECQALHVAGLDKLVPASWGCQDFQHAGHDVEDGAVNMLWNMACNPVLKLSSNHCCS